MLNLLCYNKTEKYFDQQIIIREFIMNNIKGKTPRESAIETRYLIMPDHANPYGSVFGGTIMAWIDMVAGMVAQRHAGMNVVTASIDSMTFKAPVYVGEHVILKSSVNYIGNSSMEVGVQVTKENPVTGEILKTTTAYLTFVALNEYKKPATVPKLILETEDDKRRNENAKLRVKSRKELLEKLSKK